MSFEVSGVGKSPFVEKERASLLKPTCLKVAGLVIGLLIVGSAIALHFLHVNSIATYVTGPVGGTLILGVAIWSLIDCSRKSKEKKENLRLFHEAYKGNTEEIRQVLEKGETKADLTELLEAAASAGNVETVKLLIEKGADPTKKNEGKYTALHRAIIAAATQLDNAFAIIELLLNAFPDLINKEGRINSDSPTTPLHLACTSCPDSSDTTQQHTHADLIQLLLDRGADIHAVDDKGNTPLHIIAEGTFLESSPPDIQVIEVFMKAKADISIENRSGKAPFDIIREKFSDWYKTNNEQLVQMARLNDYS